MPAPKKGKRFGGSPAHQKLMLANLASHLIISEAGAITTTEAKAKALRPYVEKLVTSNNEGFCAVSASCSFHFIAMSSNTAAPTAGQSSTGVNGASSSGDCGNAGGTAGQNGSELTTNGFVAVGGTVTDITGSSPKSSTVVNTFTDSAAATTVAQSCLVNQTGNNSAQRVNLAAATFSAITLQIGDTIQITWTITWTWV